MKPQLGDTLFNRYTLVAMLRDEPGVQAWRATDRVLAHDCQLFVLTDPSTIDEIGSLASQLGRKNGMTPVLQFRQAGGAAVLVTRVESGLSLTEYLNGPASGTISFEAMRSIIGEAAVIAASLENPRLSTDTIRISVQGVEIADTPLSPLLAEPTKAPTHVRGEQLAIRQLAAVLYALITRRPSDPDTVYDLAQVGDLPAEFQVILSRGLELVKEDGQRAEAMLTLSELTALLGDCTPLTDLTDQDLALPSEAGDGSISTALLRDLGDVKLADLPSSVISTEKLPDLTISRPLTEAEAARHAEKVVNEQNKQTFAEMQAAFDNYSPRVLGQPYAPGAEDTADQPGHLTGETIRLSTMPALPQRPGTPERQPATGEFQGFSFHMPSSSSPVAPGSNPGDETTRIPVAVDPNMATQIINVSAIRHGEGAGAAAEAATGAVAGTTGGSGRPDDVREEKTVAIPLAALPAVGHGGSHGGIGVASVTGDSVAGEGESGAGEDAANPVVRGTVAVPAAPHDLDETIVVPAGAMPMPKIPPQHHAPHAVPAGRGTDQRQNTGVSVPPAPASGAHDLDETVAGIAPVHDGIELSLPLRPGTGAQPHTVTPVAIAPAPHVRGIAATANVPMQQQPPSFTPKTADEHESHHDGAENLAQQRLFGKMTTTVVVVIVAAVVVVLAGAFAVLTFTANNTNPADKGVDKNNQWPSQGNIEDVPFGDSNQNAKQSGDSSAAVDEDDIVLIDVTAAYRR